MIKDLSQSIPANSYNEADSDQACFLCQSPRYKILHQLHHFGIPVTFKQCQCGLIKQTPLPNEKFFEWFFNSNLFYGSKKFPGSKIWGYYDYFKDEPCRLATSKNRVKKLSPFFKGQIPLQILKIGPATGTFLKVANDHGHHAIGCDISGDFVEFARKNYNVQIDQGRFENLNYKSAQFDVVVLFNVIENIPNPAEFFEEVNRVLKPNGLFIFNFVDMHQNWIAQLQRGHYFLFRPPVCYIFSLPIIYRWLAQWGFIPIKIIKDIRYLHLEKILTLLGLNSLAKLMGWLRISKIPFPIYAYPSRIVISRKPS